MKQRILSMAAMFAVVMTLAVASVNAQSGARIEASVPFDFAAGNARLKAGDYSVTRIARNAFLLRSADLKTTVLVQAPLAVAQQRADSPARLVFKRYGSEYFLAQVWVNGSADGAALYASKTEERLARQNKERNETAKMIDVPARAK
jgi:hypothetical protein